MEQQNIFRIGSRKSELALIQTKYVIECLQENNKDKIFKIITMNTKGDKILDIPLPKIGEKSLFTEELENALENSRVDFLVHSLKDLPTTLREGLAVGAILKREDPRDAVVMSKVYNNFTLDTLPPGSIIGTSSLRRSAYLARNMTHLKVETIRGNLNTRFKKLDEDDSKFAAIILAVAGLKRIGMEDRISQYLEPEETLYAVGQGALAIECRESDSRVLSLLQPLHDIFTTLRCVSERSFLKYLGGGCSAPVGVATILNNKELCITGAVLSLDGKTLIKDTIKCKLYIPDDDGEPPKKCPYREPRTYCGVVSGDISAISLYAAEKLGKDIAENLIKRNALEIMTEARNEILRSV
jgi:hydroxymethylbilane synthase